MAKINLKQYGITGTTEVIYNPSYDELYREETRKGLRGYEKGQVTEMGAVNVMTGVYTVPRKTSSSSWTKPPKILFGGPRPNTRTTTNR